MSKLLNSRPSLPAWMLTAFMVVTGWMGVRAAPAEESMRGFAEAIRLEEQLADERLAWESQRRILENEIEVLRSELAENLRRIEALRSERTAVRQRREKLLQDLAREQELANEWSGILADLLPSFRTLLDYLPDWAAALPVEPPESFGESTSPVTVFRILQEVQAEGARIHSKPAEVTDPTTGETYRVDLLALGHGAAFFASEDGSFGGRFVYDGEAWSPEIIPAYSSAIRLAIEQEQGAAEPGVVSLPISLEREP